MDEKSFGYIYHPYWCVFQVLIAMVIDMDKNVKLQEEGALEGMCCRKIHKKRPAFMKKQGGKYYRMNIIDELILMFFVLQFFTSDAPSVDGMPCINDVGNDERNDQ